MELLAPAGSPNALRAAIYSGANAVYFGLDKFNARINADNFTKENVREYVELCHLHGVKVYAISPPTLDSAADAMFFGFSTSKLTDSTNMGQIYLYYKIYNKLSVHDSEQNYLSGLAADENKSATSANRMLEYGYRELHVDKNGNGGAGVDTEVFTLSNEEHVVQLLLTAPGYDPEIVVDGTRIGTPCRTNDRNFDFFEQSDGSNKPVAEDEDTKNFANPPDTNPEAYYVALFSVFSTFDESYEPLYSPVHYLGSIKVIE